MSRKRVSIALLSVFITLAVAAMAQDEKNELGGTIGRTFISDQGIQNANYFDPIIHTGKGLTFAVEYGRRFYVTPVFAVSGEGILMINHDVDVNAGEYGHAVVPTDYRELFATPGVRLNLFPTTAVSPWVSFGAGFGHISQGSQLVYGGTNPGQSKTSAVIQAGFGLDVKAWKRLFIRGEVRDFWSGEPDFPLAPTGKTRQHNFYVAGGALWRF
ncbi:MAG TPA: outer membrane beta-barrel protein [Candidatus Sulfotelmatobacter sp.]|nr:outer membrane beta-barrel protein [Candidatus Sulfotelmatobacter sp.]